MVEKKQCAVIGATGMAGQQFIDALDGHPWFEVTSSPRRKKEAGMTYGQARRGFKAVKNSQEILDLIIQMPDEA